MQIKGFWCDVEKLAVDFKQHLGLLFMVEGHCCNMEPCIQYFKRIDPKVEQIQTFSGRIADTVYFKDSSGMWYSVDKDGHREAPFEI